MSAEIVVVDTNILFSILLREDSRLAESLWTNPQPLYVCETVLVELFKHKEKIMALSRLPEADVIRVYHSLIKHLNLFKESLIEPACWQQAYDLCRAVDEADTPHVALALHLNGWLWTGDKKLVTSLKMQGFTRLFTIPKPT
jgi:predicted nucleic acid-binding protein